MLLRVELPGCSGSWVNLLASVAKSDRTKMTQLCIGKWEVLNSESVIPHPTWAAIHQSEPYKVGTSQFFREYSPLAIPLRCPAHRWNGSPDRVQQSQAVWRLSWRSVWLILVATAALRIIIIKRSKSDHIFKQQRISVTNFFWYFLCIFIVN